VNTGTLSAVASTAGSVVSAGNNLVTAVSSTC
jgi:peptidoglycan hydrolase-like amidase